MRRNAGASLFEGAVLAIMLLAVVVLIAGARPFRHGSKSKHAVGQATIQDFSVALKAYEQDFGEYPPDEPGNYITRGGKGSVVALMSSPGPKGVPYYLFRAEDFNERGQWRTLLGTPFKYRRNAGRTRPATPDPAVMVNMLAFDMWACGYGDDPACNPATSEPASAATMKNW